MLSILNRGKDQIRASVSKLLKNNSLVSLNSQAMSTSINRNLNYDDIVRLKANQSIFLIDVRENNEIQETGKLPGSIHIPLKEIPQELNLGAEVFQKKYGVPKPNLETHLVFSCRSGNRSQKALDSALALGYLNSAHYKGGFMDWEKNSK